MRLLHAKEFWRVAFCGTWSFFRENFIFAEKCEDTNELVCRPPQNAKEQTSVPHPRHINAGRGCRDPTGPFSSPKMRRRARAGGAQSVYRLECQTKPSLDVAFLITLKPLLYFFYRRRIGKVNNMCLCIIREEVTVPEVQCRVKAGIEPLHPLSPTVH